LVRPGQSIFSGRDRDRFTSRWTGQAGESLRSAQPFSAFAASVVCIACIRITLVLACITAVLPFAHRGGAAARRRRQQQQPTADDEGKRIAGWLAAEVGREEADACLTASRGGTGSFCFRKSSAANTTVLCVQQSKSNAGHYRIVAEDGWASCELLDVRVLIETRARPAPHLRRERRGWDGACGAAEIGAARAGRTIEAGHWVPSRDTAAGQQTAVARGSGQWRIGSRPRSGPATHCNGNNYLSWDFSAVAGTAGAAEGDRVIPLPAEGGSPPAGRAATSR
jgi:hypothetical protein